MSQNKLNTSNVQQQLGGTGPEPESNVIIRVLDVVLWRSGQAGQAELGSYGASVIKRAKCRDEGCRLPQTAARMGHGMISLRVPHHKRRVRLLVPFPLSFFWR